MVICNVRQCLLAQVARVVLVRRPRVHRQPSNGVDDLPMESICQADPILQNGHLVDLRIPCYPPVRVQIRHGEMRAQPGRVLADVHDGRVPRPLLAEALPGQDVLADDGLLAVDAQVEVEHRLPQRREVDEVALLARVLLRDLQLDGGGRLAQVREERRRGLAHLEVDGAVLDLHDDVVVELAVEVAEEVDGRVRPVVLPVALVEVLAVVHEGPEHEDAAVRRERARKEVRALGERAVVRQRARLALAVRLERVAREVGHVRVELVGLVAPPGDDGGVERVEGGQAAEGLRRGEVHRDADAHAPGAHGVGEAAEPGHVGVAEEGRVGVDVVHDDAVDADRGEQARVLGGARRVRHGAAVGEEDGEPRVPALDRAGHVVPLVDPADRRARVRGVGDLGEVALREHREVFERAVQRAALVLAQDLDSAALGVQPEAILLELGGLGLSASRGECIDGADHDGWACLALIGDVDVTP